MSCPRGCPSPQPAELSGTPSAGGGPAQRSFSPLQPSSADPAKAFEWYRRAAVGGEARAQYNIGLLYLSGKGVVADPVQAVKWLVLAASTARDPDIRRKAQATLNGISPALKSGDFHEGAQAARLWLVRRQWTSRSAGRSGG